MRAGQTWKRVISCAFLVVDRSVLCGLVDVANDLSFVLFSALLCDHMKSNTPLLYVVSYDESLFSFPRPR